MNDGGGSRIRPEERASPAHKPELCLHRWYDEITLRELADKSGVALQTIVNHFGTKEGVLAAMLEDPRAASEFGGRRQQANPGDIAGAVELLMSDYEHGGDALIRFLALESRMPALASLLAFGRGNSCAVTRD